MENLDAFTIIDNTTYKRFRDVSEEKIIYYYCVDCKIATKTFEASTFYKFCNCDKYPQKCKAN